MSAGAGLSGAGCQGRYRLRFGPGVRHGAQHDCQETAVFRDPLEYRKGQEMKKSYEKPQLVKKDRLSAVTARPGASTPIL
jgi:hypothetical protein